MSPVDALYARVSTGRQEHERTIESQLEALTTRVRTDHPSGSPPRVFRDEGYSGARLDRPGLDALRDAAADGQIGTLYVYDPDRLARNFVHQQVLLEEFERRGVPLVFVQRPLSDRPEDRMLAQMQGIFAEYERTKIVERTRRGRLYKARMGLYAWTNPPYGFRVTRGLKGAPAVISIHEGESPWVRKMFEWVVEEGLSGRQVAKRLNRLEVRPRKSEVWNQASVRVILRNPAYAGTTYYNCRESAEPRRRRRLHEYPRTWKSSHRTRPKEEWIAVPVPALVSPEMQGRAKEVLHRHRWDLPRNTLYPYLLRTLVVCGECGLRMGASTLRSWWPRHTRGGREWYPYYDCKAHTRGPEDTGRLTKCPSRRVRADRLDEVVWSSLGEFLQKPEVLKVEIATYAEDRRRSTQGEETEANRQEERRRQLSRQRTRLVDAYQAGLLDQSELKMRGERIEAEEGEARRRLAELQALKVSGVKAEELYREAEAFCARLREGLERLTFEDRVKVVRWLVERVVVKGGEVIVEHVIPLTGRFRRNTPGSDPPRPGPPAGSPPQTEAVAASIQTRMPARRGDFGGMWLQRRVGVQGTKESICTRSGEHDQSIGGGGTDLGLATDVGGEPTTAQRDPLALTGGGEDPVSTDALGHRLPGAVGKDPRVADGTAPEEACGPRADVRARAHADGEGARSQRRSREVQGRMVGLSDNA